MAGELTVYSFKNVAVTVDGSPVTGFWEGDDAVQINPRADNATEVVGVDGTATVSISADDSVFIVLKLQANSPMNTVLNNKFRQMRNGMAYPFAISVRNTGNGEGGSSAYCVVKKAPPAQFGEKASAREWTLFASPWAWNAIAYGA